MLCAECGFLMEDGMESCPGCGAPVVEAPKKPKKKPVLIVVSILLGFILGVGAWLGISLWQNARDYDKATALLAEQQYDQALVLFKELGGYKDSAAQAQKLEKQQADYTVARQLMKDHKYDAAGEAFAALADFKDSEDLARYTEAQAAFAGAQDDEAFVAAAELFAAMGEYMDCEAMVSKSYLEAAHCAVEAGDKKAIEAHLEKVSDADLQAFEETYHDAEVLAEWERALELRYEMETDKEAGFDFSEELSILKKFEGVPCRERKLSLMLSDYIKAVESQQDDLDEEGYIIDFLDFYEQELERSRILNRMYDSFYFLDENDELYDWYIDMEEYFEMLYDIEFSLDLWASIADLQKSGGKYYVDYTNTSDYDFTLYVTFYYYDAQGELISKQTLYGPVESEESLRFILKVPANMETWDLNYSFGDYEE